MTPQSKPVRRPVTRRAKKARGSSNTARVNSRPVSQQEPRDHHLKDTYSLMVKAITKFAAESGVGTEDLKAVLRDVHERVARGKPLGERAPNYGGLTERVMGAYAQWWTDPDYLENGMPAALRVRGRAPSVESLLRDHVHANELQDGIQLMGESPGISVEGDEKWRPVSAAFLSPTYHRSSLDRVARVFAGWLATLRLNSSTVDVADGMFEQTLITTAIPKSYLPVLKRNARALLCQSLRSLYTPVLRAERLPGSRIEGEVGIQVFMYQLPGAGGTSD